MTGPGVEQLVSFLKNVVGISARNKPVLAAGRSALRQRSVVSVIRRRSGPAVAAVIIRSVETAVSAAGMVGDNIFLGFGRNGRLGPFFRGAVDGHFVAVRFGLWLYGDHRGRAAHIARSHSTATAAVVRDVGGGTGRTTSAGLCRQNGQ